MNYYVIGPDGSKYGPADANLLNAWILEGRIAPMTMLETETGLRVAAATVQGLNFPNAQGPAAGQYVQQPGYQTYTAGQSNYYRQPGFGSASSSGTEVILSWVFGAITILAGWACCIVSIGCSSAGIILAVNAKRKNQQGAQVALIFNIVVLALYLVGAAVYTVFVVKAMSTPRWQ